MAVMSTLCSCSPMRNTLQRRLSSRSSLAEYSCTDSTPFWSSSVLLGLGRSSEGRARGQSSRPGRAPAQFDPVTQTSYWLIFIGCPLMRINRLPSKAHLLLFLFGFHAFCWNQQRETLVQLSKHLPAAYMWMRRHGKMMIVGLKRAKKKNRRSNENRDPLRLANINFPNIKITDLHQNNHLQ